MAQKCLADFVADGRIPVIMGTTASGKSALALKLAEHFNGEIISADSMQFYRGLSIGVAKPTDEERRRIPHHLLDTMDITEKSDIFRFCSDAELAVQDIRSRKKLPIVVGGSGLYLHAFIYGLDPLPSRQSLRDELDSLYDNDAHFEELAQLVKADAPDDYAAFYPHRRKIIRAREIFLLTGTSMCKQQKHAAIPRPDIHSFILDWSREDLWVRIRSRTEQMLASGWIAEAETMIGKGLLSSPTAWQALGYAQIGRYLAGELNHEELVEQIVIATRQFARRQRTWFAHQHPEAEVISMPCKFM